MKKYVKLNIEILLIENTDIITESGFYGGFDDFTSSSSNSASDGETYRDNA